MRALIRLILVSALAGCAPPPAPAQPSWSAAALDDLEAVAASAAAEGLPSEDAALAELARFRHLGQTDPAAEAQADIAADALFASLARAFAQGGSDPSRADPDWAIPLAPPPDLAALHAAREANALPAALLRPLLPQTIEYAQLRDELARLRAQAASSGQSDERIGRLRASMERWRWLPRRMPDRRIEVRIPHFELRLTSPDSPAAAHKVIVGARATQTPSFVTEIRSVTFNPSWDPPASIAAELLRRFRRDPSAAAREGFDVLDADGAILAPDAVDWSRRPFPYRLRQRPGPANALGRVRFDMANAYAIRMHDTPDRSLFERERRALSHGCIRVEAPEDLAARALAAQGWTLDSVNAAIETAAQQTVPLAEPLPVYLIYITAVVSEAGEVAYGDDVYHRDGAVVAALDAPDIALVRQAAARPVRCPAAPALP